MYRHKQSDTLQEEIPECISVRSTTAIKPTLLKLVVNNNKKQRTLTLGCKKCESMDWKF